MGHGSFVGCRECRARATSYVVGHGSFVGCRARATSYVVGHGSYSNRCTPRLGVKYIKIKINTGPAVGKIFHKKLNIHTPPIRRSPLRENFFGCIRIVAV